MQNNHAFNTIATQGEREGELLIRVAFPPSTAAEGSPLIPWEHTGIERETLRGLAASGELAAVKIGRKWYVKRADLVALFDARRGVVTPKPKRAPPVKAATEPDVLQALSVRARRARSCGK